MLDWLVEILSPDTRERNPEYTSHLRDSEDEVWELPLVACGRQLGYLEWFSSDQTDGWPCGCHRSRCHPGHTRRSGGHGQKGFLRVLEGLKKRPNFRFGHSNSFSGQPKRHVEILLDHLNFGKSLPKVVDILSELDQEVMKTTTNPLFPIHVLGEIVSTVLIQKPLDIILHNPVASPEATKTDTEQNTIQESLLSGGEVFHRGSVAFL